MKRFPFPVVAGLSLLLASCTLFSKYVFTLRVTPGLNAAELIAVVGKAIAPYGYEEPPQELKDATSSFYLFRGGGTESQYVTVSVDPAKGIIGVRDRHGSGETQFTAKLQSVISAAVYQRFGVKPEFRREYDYFSLRPNPSLQPTVLAFGVALPSQRYALFGAAELQR